LSWLRLLVSCPPRVQRLLSLAAVVSEQTPSQQLVNHHIHVHSTYAYPRSIKRHLTEHGIRYTSSDRGRLSLLHHTNRIKSAATSKWRTRCSETIFNTLHRSRPRQPRCLLDASQTSREDRYCTRRTELAVLYTLQHRRRHRGPAISGSQLGQQQRHRTHHLDKRECSTTQARAATKIAFEEVAITCKAAPTLAQSSNLLPPAKCAFPREESGGP
jgi:hypothetical protein